MQNLTPPQIVTELDRYIVGQADAKRAVAVAVLMTHNAMAAAHVSANTAVAKLNRRRTTVF